MKTYTDADLMKVFLEKIAEAGNQNKLAKEWKVSRTYIGDIVQGQRSISGIAERLGFELIKTPPPPKTYKRKEENK